MQKREKNELFKNLFKVVKKPEHNLHDVIEQIDCHYFKAKVRYIFKF